MVTPHHYYYRSGYGHLKYDLENGIILCRKCHFALHFGKDPKKIEDRIREVRGRKWENRLFKKSKEKHYSYQTIDYYNKIIKQLQKL
uniref:HNH endonuclease n=1 Tax=viral metagenome TaxID=1070528 RepID=A0A6M3Y1D4_9ZZZZ